MKKKNLLIVIATAAMLSLGVVGCGSEETTATPSTDYSLDASTEVEATEESTEVVESTEVIEETTETEATVEETVAVEESTEETAVDVHDAVAPAPTEDYFSKNGITINGIGDFTYAGTAPLFTNETDYTTEFVDLTGNIEISTVDNGNGTSTVTTVITQAPHIFDESTATWGIGGCSFVADKYTGKAYISLNLNEAEQFAVTLDDGTVIDMTVTATFKDASIDSDRVETYTVVIPSDYDGLVFGLTGYDASIDENTLWGSTFSVTEVPNGECDAIYFAQQ